MRKLILSNFQSPGDVVMLTAAVRDLHQCYPGQFSVDVRTSAPELWENNPWLTPLDPNDPEVEIIACQYPTIHQSNQRPLHFLHGFIRFLNERLKLQIEPTLFKGDIHLSALEKAMPSPLATITGANVPYWLIVAGGKYDFTIKWWHFRRWQSVVDHFRDQVLFVQVGEKGHYHPALHGAMDLRGKTSLRDLIRLTYFAQGVVCPVTLLMHLAAAVDVGPDLQPARPCVVVAGGRESPHWEAYPTHQFLHTVGTLPCCAEGGCWRSRTVPLGDGDGKDQAEHLCLDVVGPLPHCMHEISARQVTDQIALYLRGRSLPLLTPHQASILHPFLRLSPQWKGAENQELAHTHPTGPAQTLNKNIDLHTPCYANQ